MIRKGLVWGTLVYTLGLLGLALLWRLGVDVWWVALPGIVAPFLFLPLVLLVPLGFWLRSRTYLLSVSVLVLVFGFSFGGRLLPRLPVGDSPNSTEMRVMTFNQLKTNTDEAAVKAAILRSEADIVALQELSPKIATMLRAELSEVYPYQALRPAPADGTQNGVGVVSRFPLERPSYSEAYRGQHFDVNNAGKRFEFINVHFNVPFQNGRMGSLRFYEPRVRDRQLDALMAVAKRASSLVVVGDFNLSDNESGYRKMATLMTDAYRNAQTGFGFSYPAQAVYRGLPLPPLVRLDYVWLRGLEPIAAYRDCRGGSDHCALISVIRLP